MVRSAVLAVCCSLLVACVGPAEKIVVVPVDGSCPSPDVAGSAVDGADQPDLTKPEVDAAGMQVDAAGEQVDAAEVQVDAAEPQSDAAQVQVDAAEPQSDAAGEAVDVAEVAPDLLPVLPACSPTEVAALTTVSGASLAETAVALAQIEETIGSLSGNASPTNIAEALATLRAARDALKSNQATVGSAIDAVNGELGHSGTTSERAAAVIADGVAQHQAYVALSAQVAQLTEASGLDLAGTTQAIAALRQATGGASLADTQTAIASMMAATGATSVGDAAANLQTVKTLIGGSGATLQEDVNAAIFSVGTNATLKGAIADVVAVLGGSGTVYARAVAIKVAIGGDTSDVTSGLADTIANLEAGAASVAAAIADIETKLGGVGTVYARATAQISATNALLAAAGAATVADVTTVVTQMKSCANASSLASAKTALCSNAGYAALKCPQGGAGGNAFMVVAMTGFSSATFVSTDQAASVVSLVINDGSPGHPYSIETGPGGINLGDGTGGTTPLANGSTITLTHGASGNAITLLNTGSAITSASALRAAIDTTFVGATLVDNNSCTAVAALNADATEEAALLAASGAESVADVTSLINSLKGCMRISNFSMSARNLICNDRGIASLQCPTGGGGGGALIISTPNDMFPNVFGPVTTDGMGGVNLVVPTGLGDANGVYNLSASAIANGISANAAFTMTNGPYAITFINVSGVRINNLTQALTVVSTYNNAYMAPNRCSDLGLAERNLGVAGGGTVGQRLGVLVNQLQMGAPSLQSAITSMSSVINAANVNNDAGLFNSVAELQSAIDLRGQLSAFLTLWDPSSWSTGGLSSITVDTSTPPQSLSDLINHAVSTQ